MVGKLAQLAAMAEQVAEGKVGQIKVQIVQKKDETSSAELEEFVQQLAVVVVVRRRAMGSKLQLVEREELRLMVQAGQLAELMVGMWVQKQQKVLAEIEELVADRKEAQAHSNHAEIVEMTLAAVVQMDLESQLVAKGKVVVESQARHQTNWAEAGPSC